MQHTKHCSANRQPASNYRDDYQMMTSDVASAVAGGLQYISGTYHVFGNNGTVGIGAAVR